VLTRRPGSAGTNGTNGAAAAAANGKPAGAQLIKGGAATLARYMDESRSIPTATSFRTITVTTMDGRRKELKAAGQKVSFTHLIAYAIALTAQQDMPVMAHHFLEVDGKPHRVDDEPCNLGIAVDVEKKDGTRTLMVPVIRDAGRMSFTDFKAAFDALIDKARDEQPRRRRPHRREHLAHEPGRHRHDRLGPAAHDRPGHDRRDGLDRLPRRPGQRRRDDRRREGHDDDLDVRPPDHPGGRVGALPPARRGVPAGRARLLRGRLLRARRHRRPAARAPGARRRGRRRARDGRAGRRVRRRHGKPSEELMQAVQAASSLVKAHRTHGHLAARLDPLGGEPEGDPALDPREVHLTPELMAQIPARILRVNVPGATVADALPHLAETYCGTIAYEIEHLGSHRQRVWLREKIESGEFRKPLTTDEQTWLLGRLIKVDAFERFIHKAYLGQKQFSIEGLDITIPMLDQLIHLAAAHGGREVVMGMAHRGRLNVLRHNLGRPVRHDLRRVRGRLDARGGHDDPAGRHGRREVPPRPAGQLHARERPSILVNLESNPVAPRVRRPRSSSGATRAAQTTRQGPHAHQDTQAALPIMLHGDAAFPGQGVVAETLNLQALDGYQVGGSIHIITNNQVGFTTDPTTRARRAGRPTWPRASTSRSSTSTPTTRPRASPRAPGLRVPPGVRPRRRHRPHRLPPLRPQRGRRARVHAARDVREDQGAPRVADLWAARLVEQGVTTKDDVEQRKAAIWDELTQGHQQLKATIAAAAEQDGGAGEDHPTGEYQLDRSPSPSVETKVEIDRLRALNEDLLRTPDGFTVHPKLVRQLQRRRDALGGRRRHRLGAGRVARLRVARHRGHADPPHRPGRRARDVLPAPPRPARREDRPDRLPDPEPARRARAVRAAQQPAVGDGLRRLRVRLLAGGAESLVLWEAQFGDFVNGAQVIIDQFIVAGLAKWGQTSRLTLLLPHGYEGSGPEHSSAGLERWLALAAEGNLRVANLTTPAQYFHLLRRQAQIAKQRPLVLMTPKSLLRLPQATNRIEHLSETKFFPVLGEPRVPLEKVTRLLLCTGKIYYDLVGHPDRAGARRSPSGGSSCSTPSRRARSWSSSASTRTSARSCGSRRSRGTWAPART
jgi:2-oxoglutarate dehydrogenase E1 component